MELLGVGQAEPEPTEETGSLPHVTPQSVLYAGGSTTGTRQDFEIGKYCLWFGPNLLHPYVGVHVSVSKYVLRKRVCMRTHAHSHSFEVWLSMPFSSAGHCDPVLLFSTSCLSMHSLWLQLVLVTLLLLWTLTQVQAYAANVSRSHKYGWVASRLSTFILLPLGPRHTYPLGALPFWPSLSFAQSNGVNELEKRIFINQNYCWRC